MTDRSDDASIPFPESPGAEQLAEALRRDLAVRARWTADDEGEIGTRLAALGDVERLAPVAKRGVAAPAIKAVRGVLRAFLRPWLAAQTIFNREAARHLESVARTVRDLERRVPHLERGLRHLDDRTRTLQPPIHTPAQVTSVNDTEKTRLLEQLFVQMRLPPPPARVLARADAALAARLASLGFEVVPARGAAPPAAPAGSRYDAIVWLTASETAPSESVPTRPDVHALARLLAPAGRLLASLRMPAGTGASAAAAAADAWFAPLRVASVVMRRGDAVWMAGGTVDNAPPSLALDLLVDARADAGT